MDSLKTFVKQIPGAVYAVRQLRKFLPDRTHRHLQGGDWLYRREIVEWLCESSARKQLPPLFRLFGAYCAYQHRSGAERVIGGREIHRTIISLGKLLHLKDSTALTIDSKIAFVDLNDPRMLQIPNEISDSYPDTSILKRLLDPGDTFVDVGANHGSFSIAASKAIGPKGLIVAIEPQPRKAELVKKSLAANADCEYRVHCFACGDDRSEADFYIPAGSSGGASVFAEYAAVVRHQRLRVPVRRLDDATDWRSFPGRVFMKVDVEGSEPKFLSGAREMIRARKPGIMLEVNHASMAASGETKENFVQRLDALGYSEFFEVRPFSGPLPLSKLFATGRSDVRNIIVATRDALPKIRLVAGLNLFLAFC
jgi:FkbM family methyltransferase